MATLVTQWLFFESHCHSERLIWQPLALRCPGFHAPVVTYETPATPAATLTPCDRMQCSDTDIQATVLAAEVTRGNKTEMYASTIPSASTSGDTRWCSVLPYKAEEHMLLLSWPLRKPKSRKVKKIPKYWPAKWISRSLHGPEGSIHSLCQTAFALRRGQTCKVWLLALLLSRNCWQVTNHVLGTQPQGDLSFTCSCKDPIFTFTELTVSLVGNSSIHNREKLLMACCCSYNQRESKWRGKVSIGIH